jgi:RNA polymerase sigma factor (sigma-70 family)
MSDGELVHQALSGRREAYEELVRRWAARVLAICHARVGRADVAEDLAQEALVRGWIALRSLSDPEKFGAWLHGIAVRACLDWLKAKARTQVAFSDLVPDGNAENVLPGRDVGDPGDLERSDELRQLLSEVEALPEELRKVLMLYYYEDVTYRDMAQMLGVSAPTVNARLTKARALLRRRLSRSRR